MINPIKKERKERLLALAALLAIVPEEKFNMHTWRGNVRGSGMCDVNMTRSFNDCGTVACALGHAISAFPQFRITGSDTVVYQGVRYFVTINSMLELAQKFFHLTAQEANALFLPDNLDVTKKEEIKLIKAAARV